jgi:L-serine dehydratase
MKARAAFVASLKAGGLLDRVARVRVDLFGSLAWTGKGHGTDKAMILGLVGEQPDTADPDHAKRLVAEVGARSRLRLGGGPTIAFAPDGGDIVFDGIAETLRHPNTLGSTALAADGAVLAAERWCSVGVGLVAREDEADAAAEVERHLERVIGTMMACIERGMTAEGELPGGLKVRRRAKAIRERLEADQRRNARPPHEVMDWVSLYAIAVNEENAAGGRVVTAPTNGAAGVVPAVLRYYRDHCPGADPAGLRAF